MLIDPLQVNVPLAHVERSFPLVPEGDYELRITSSKIEPNYDKSALQWSLQYELTNPTTSIDGKDIKAGFKVFPDWPLALAPRADGKGGAEWEGCQAQKGLAIAVDTIFGSPLDFTNELANSAVGKTVIGRVTIDTDKNGVQRNKVTRLKKATA